VFSGRFAFCVFLHFLLLQICDISEKKCPSPFKIRRFSYAERIL
jgi:hypothetical protein